MKCNTRKTALLGSLYAITAVSTISAFHPQQTFSTTRTRTSPLVDCRISTTLSKSSPSTTQLSQSKNSDRAHIERNLEAAMDNDWRVFRAKLVAQEKAQGGGGGDSSAHQQHRQRQQQQQHQQHQQQQQQPQSSLRQRMQTPHQLQQQRYHQQHQHQAGGDPYMNDAKLQRQGQIGDLFAGAISSIFSKGSHSGGHQHVTVNPHQPQFGREMGGSLHPPRPAPSSRDIFDGRHLGGGAMNSLLRVDADLEGVDPQALLAGDPFVSRAELPLFIKPGTTPTIDKHRWAHEISHLEPGCVLLANEKLGGVFHQTVVLIIEHHPATGTFGVVINRPLEGNLAKIGSEPTSKLDLSLKMAFSKTTVTYGGPVLPDEFSILHSYGEVDGARKLCPGVYIGGSEELMHQVRNSQSDFDPQQALFVKGHAAWVPGQLQREINKGVWYTAAASSDLVLRHAGAPITAADEQPHDLWTDIMLCLGSPYRDIALRHGGTGDERRMMP